MRVPIPHGQIFEIEPELTLLAQYVFAVARREPYLCKLAIAWTLRNIAAATGTQPLPWREIILSGPLPLAEVAMGPDLESARRPLTVANEAVWVDCFRAAACTFFDAAGDPTRVVRGATRYYRVDRMPEGARKDPTAVIIGSYCFYRPGGRGA